MAAIAGDCGNAEEASFGVAVICDVGVSASANGGGVCGGGVGGTAADAGAGADIAADTNVVCGIRRGVLKLSSLSKKCGGDRDGDGDGAGATGWRCACRVRGDRERERERQIVAVDFDCSFVLGAWSAVKSRADRVMRPAGVTGRVLVFLVTRSREDRRSEPASSEPAPRFIASADNIFAFVS